MEEIAIDIVNEEDECVEVLPEEDTLSVGERTRLIFDHGSRFDVFLLGPEGETGFLTANGQTGTALYGVTEPVYYVAPDEIRGDEVTVQFWARIHKPGSGGAGANAQVNTVEDAIREGALSTNQQTMQKDQMLQSLASTACMMSKATIGKPNFPLCVDNMNYEDWEIEIINNNNQCGDGGNVWKWPLKWLTDDPTKEYYIFPEICFDEANKCYGLMIPKVSSILFKCIGGPCCVWTKEINSKNDVKDEEEAKYVIKELDKQVKRINEIIEKYRSLEITGGDDLSWEEKRIDMSKVYYRYGILRHEENHMAWFFEIFRKALIITKQGLPACTQLKGMNINQIEEYFKPKIKELQEKYTNILNGIEKTDKKYMEISSYTIQLDLTKQLIEDIKKEFRIKDKN